MIRNLSYCLIACMSLAFVGLNATAEDDAKKDDAKVEKKEKKVRKPKAEGDQAKKAAARKKDKKPRNADAKKKRNAARMKKAFAQRDKNKDGFLTAEEFVVIPKKLTDEAKVAKRKKNLVAQFKRKDKNSDGKLALKEFVAKPQRKPAQTDKKKNPNKRKKDKQQDR